MLRWLLLFVSLLHVGCKRPATSDDGDVLATLQSFLLFVGYQRSGSTLVASVLDQHPNIVITHEYDVLRHWKSLEQAPELFLRQLLKQAQHDAKKKQLLFNGYNFSCQPQLSGTYNDQLLVLGLFHFRWFGFFEPDQRLSTWLTCAPTHHRRQESGAHCRAICRARASAGVGAAATFRIALRAAALCALHSQPV